jgi:hypothetical protein
VTDNINIRYFQGVTAGYKYVETNVQKYDRGTILELKMTVFWAISPYGGSKNL